MAIRLRIVLVIIIVGLATPAQAQMGQPYDPLSEPIPAPIPAPIPTPVDEAPSWFGEEAGPTEQTPPEPIPEEGTYVEEVGPTTTSDSIAEQSAPETAVLQKEAEPTASAELSDRDVIIGIAIVLGVVALGIAVPVTATHSANRYGYLICRNWNVLLWIVGGLTLAIGVFIAAATSEVSIALRVVIITLGLAPWIIAVYRNIRGTNLIFGLWISLIQVGCAVLCIIVYGIIMRGIGEQRRAEFFRNHTVN